MKQNQSPLPLNIMSQHQQRALIEKAEGYFRQATGGNVTLPGGFFWSELVQTVVAEYQKDINVPSYDVIAVQPRCVVEMAGGLVTNVSVNKLGMSVVIHDPDVHTQANEGASSDQLDSAMSAIERETTGVAFLNAMELTLGLDPRQEQAKAFAVQKGAIVVALTIEDGAAQNAFTDSPNLQVVVHDHDEANLRWGKDESTRLLSLAKQGCVKSEFHDSAEYFFDQQVSSDDPRQRPD